MNHLDLQKYLAPISKRKNRFYQLKRFAKYLYNTDNLPEKEWKLIEQFQIKDDEITIFNQPEKEKKWSVPFNRWNEVYDKLNTKTKRMGAFLGFNFGL